MTFTGELFVTARQYFSITQNLQASPSKQCGMFMLLCALTVFEVQTVIGVSSSSSCRAVWIQPTELLNLLVDISWDDGSIVSPSFASLQSAEPKFAPC